MKRRTQIRKRKSHTVRVFSERTQRVIVRESLPPAVKAILLYAFSLVSVWILNSWLRWELNPGEPFGSATPRIIIIRFVIAGIVTLQLWRLDFPSTIKRMVLIALLMFAIGTCISLASCSPSPKTPQGWKYRVEGNIRTAKGPHPTIAYVDSFRVEGDTISWENSNGTQLRIAHTHIDTLR